MNKIKLIDLTIDNKGQYGLGASASPFNMNYPLYLRITDIDDNSYVGNLPTCVNPNEYIDYKNYLLSKNDIVFARTGNSTGRNYFYNGEFKNVVFAGFLIKFALDPNKVVPQYVSYYCQSQKYKATIDLLSNGSTRKNLNAHQFGEIEIPMYSSNMQQHIVNIIGSIDDLIESNKTKIFNLQSICNEKFKNINLDNSNSVKMNEIFNVIIGRTPPRKEKEWFSNEKGFKWISISDMGRANIYVINTDEYLTNDAVNKFKVPIVPKNTILLSFKLTVGRISITTEDMVTNEAIAAFTNCPKNLFYYLYFYLKNYNFSNAGSTSSIATAINSKIIKELEFIVPQENELSNFNELVKPCFDLIDNLNKINQNLRELKQKYLNKFFG